MQSCKQHTYYEAHVNAEFFNNIYIYHELSTLPQHQPESVVSAPAEVACKPSHDLLKCGPLHQPPVQSQI